MTEPGRMARLSQSLKRALDVRRTGPKDSSAADLYRPLDVERKEIRLLLLEPGIGPQPVRCDLRHTLLTAKRCQDCEAVSYGWGDPTIRGVVYLNGRALNVPASAEAAFRGMRSPDASRLLWLNAVSINQDDSDERSQQVGIMYEIYSRSLRTLVWLGDGMLTTEEVLKSISVILDDVEQEFGPQTHLHELVRRENFIRMESWRRDGMEAATEKHPRFYTRPWFSRLWVVQEVTLAKSSRCVLTETEMPLSSILTIAVWLHNSRLSLAVDIHLELGLNYARSILNVVNLKSTDASAEHTYMNILELFRYFRNSRTSDSRDHVYGLIGLYRWLRPDVDLPEGLTPDYKKSLGQVLRDATRYSVRENRDLFLFSELDGGSASEMNFDCRPSWVSSWNLDSRSSQRPNHLAQFFCTDNGNGLAQLIVGPVQDRDTLPVLGFQVDRIPTITSAMMNFASCKDVLTFVHESLTASMVARPSDDIVTLISDSVASTWIAGTNISREPATSDDLTDCAKWCSLVTAERTTPEVLQRDSPAG